MVSNETIPHNSWIVILKEYGSRIYPVLSSFLLSDTEIQGHVISGGLTIHRVVLEGSHPPISCTCKTIARTRENRKSHKSYRILRLSSHSGHRAQDQGQSRLLPATPQPSWHPHASRRVNNGTTQRPTRRPSTSRAAGNNYCSHYQGC